MPVGNQLQVAGRASCRSRVLVRGFACWCTERVCTPIRSSLAVSTIKAILPGSGAVKINSKRGAIMVETNQHNEHQSPGGRPHERNVFVEGYGAKNC